MSSEFSLFAASFSAFPPSDNNLVIVHFLLGYTIQFVVFHPRNYISFVRQRILFADQRKYFWQLKDSIWNDNLFTVEGFLLITILNRIVYYVPRRTMRVIAWRATMLAGDRSRGAISPASIVASLVISRMCALARILFYVTSVRIRVFMRTLESNLVLYSSCLRR